MERSMIPLCVQMPWLLSAARDAAIDEDVALSARMNRSVRSVEQFNLRSNGAFVQLDFGLIPWKRPYGLNALFRVLSFAVRMLVGIHLPRQRLLAVSSLPIEIQV
ncbi:hypothetical protein PCAR4_460148 [Paraburkholderia caribensis]|nr:hypothetical protein PCAR4_460148 [Paraburkholderia caribensis]